MKGFESQIATFGSNQKIQKLSHNNCPKIIKQALKG